MRYVQYPPSLLALYSTFQSTMKLSPSFVPHLPVSLDPIPDTWTQRSYHFFGGNFMCGINNIAPHGFQFNFGFEQACNDYTGHAVAVFPEAGLFGLRTAPASPQRICQACGSTTASCTAFFARMQQELDSMIAPDLGLWDELVKAAQADLAHVQVAQLAQNASILQLLRQSLVEPGESASWPVFGWAMVYDWLLGRREVITMEGDHGAITIMTMHHQLVDTYAFEPDVPHSLGFYLHYTTSYVAAVSVGVAVLTALYCVATRSRALVGRNLMHFHRVVGCVWIGRPLVFMRGMCAIVLLSTARLELVQDKDNLTRFIAVHRSVPESMLVAGESLWVLHVLHDMVDIGTALAHVSVPLSTAVAWIAVVFVDILAPVETSTAIDRNCHMESTYLVCTAGQVHMGSSDRMLVVVGIFVGATVLAIGATHAYARLTDMPPTRPFLAPLVVPSSVESLLDMPSQDKSDAVQSMDIIMCIMGGLLPFYSLRGHPCLFDVKLWSFVPCEIGRDWLVHVGRPVFAPVVHSAIEYSPPLAIHCSPSAVRPDGPTERSVQGLVPDASRLKVVCSLIYLVAVLTGSLTFVMFAEEGIANDFLWAGFNSSGFHAALATWLNMQMFFGDNIDSPTSLELDFADWTNYTQADGRVTTYPAYANLIQHDGHSGADVAKAVEGLRRTAGYESAWMATQYCWLDFGRQWEMANSAARQGRCHQLYRQNGAVFFESVLRNVEWASWQFCLGVDCLSAFELAFGAHLEATAPGRAWWRRIKTTSAALLPVVDEAAVWRLHGVTHFTTQWQNYKTIGITDSFDVVNALGLSYPLSLHSTNYSFRVAMQTSFKLYWTFAADLWAVSAQNSPLYGMSLLRQSANFAFDNTTITSVLPLMDPYFYAYPATYPTFALTQEMLGPFGSIDSRILPRPPQLVVLYERLVNLTLELGERLPDALTPILAIPPQYWTLKGYQKWEGSGLYLRGGNFLCPGIFDQSSPVSNGCLGLFGLGGCLETNHETFQVDGHALLVAVAAWQTRTSLVTPNATFLCSGRGTSPECPRSLAVAANASRQLLSFGIPPPLAHLAYAAIQADAIEIVQFSDTSILRMPLFHQSEVEFELFGWLLLLDWAKGLREVVEFQGDVGSIKTMSGLLTKTTWHVNPWEIPANVVDYVRAAVTYVTGTLALVASMALGYAVVAKGHIEPHNVLQFNRVAGVVWVGRPLLFLRSMVAMALLTTAKVEFVRDVGPFSRMRSPPASSFSHYFRAMLSSGEACWLIYVLQDIFNVVSLDDDKALASYTGWASIVVWIISATLSCAYPVKPVVTLHRTCTVVATDLQLQCQSGQVAIGDFHRFLTLALLAVGSVIVSRAVHHLRIHPTTSASSSLFLSNGAKLLLKRRHLWICDSVQYLDLASAVMAGLLVCSWCHTLFVLDVKTWRLYKTHAPTFASPNHPQRFRRAIPLTE